MAIADAEGLDAVSMRQVAERLGVGTMSLYTHVPGKAELADLMIDTAYGELYADVDEPARQQGGWRRGMQFVAQRNWELFQRHPWLLQIAGARPVLGPHASAKYEAELRPLEGIGLSDLEMDSILTLVLTHVEATARARASMAQAQRETGMSETEWWVAVSPALATAMAGAHFPVASRVGQAAGMAHQASANPEHTFTFGLELILDGADALLAGRESG